VDEQVLSDVMASIDPARDLTDATLNELFSHDTLMANIASRIAHGSPERTTAKEPLWHRAPALVGAAVAALALVVAGSATLLSPSPSAKPGATTPISDSVTPTTTRTVSGVTLTSSRYVVPKKCVASQISEWMVGSVGPYVAGRTYKEEVIYANTGKACQLASTYLGVQTTVGKDHTVVGEGSVFPTSLSNRRILLKSGHTAAATIVIASTSSLSFQQMLMSHDGTCAPKLVDTVKVLGLYSGWPTRYFALPARYAVCTTGFDNVSAGPVALTKRIVVHG
jgi:hypothetical protein